LPGLRERQCMSAKRNVAQVMPHSNAPAEEEEPAPNAQAARASRWSRDGVSFRGRASAARKSALSGDDDITTRMTELEQQVAGGMSQMEERVAASEDSIKVRVAQMEVALMGAIKSSVAWGHPSTPRVEEDGPSLGGGRRKTNSGATSALDESDEPGTSHAYELYRTGQNVLQMQSLVEGDKEIRATLQGLRRQATRAATNGSALVVNNDDDDAPVQDSFDSLRRCLKIFFGPVMHPDSRFLSIWNVTLAVLIVYCGIAIPFEIAFEDDMFYDMCSVPAMMNERPTLITAGMRYGCTEYLVWFWVNVVVDLWFIADVFLNLRTGYVVEGLFVDDGVMAIRHYLRGSFLFDFVGSFPLNLILLATVDFSQQHTIDAARSNKILRTLRLAKLTKLFRIIKLGTYLEYAEVVVKFNPGLLRIFKLVLASISCAIGSAACGGSSLTSRSTSRSSGPTARSRRRSTSGTRR